MLSVVIKNGETWLICGGRDFSDQAMFDQVMSQLLGMWGCPQRVVHGDATGADRMAGAWGERLAIDVVAVPADWDKHGKSAGPIRNDEMLHYHRPRRVIAFPGGAGTADMVKRSRKLRDAGEVLDVVEITPSE